MLKVFNDTLVHWLEDRCHFGGNNTTFTFVRTGVKECAEQLSLNNNIDLFLFLYFWSRSISQFSKIALVIQAFWFASYWIRLLLTFLKHRGFCDLPIKSKGDFSEPSILAPTKTVIILSVLYAFLHYMFLLLKPFFCPGCTCITVLFHSRLLE